MSYEQLSSSAKKAEAEWLENKTTKAKATAVADPGKKERDKLKTQIDKLLVELNKKDKGFSRNRRVMVRLLLVHQKVSPRSKGPDIASTGPFHIKVNIYKKSSKIY